MTSLCNGFVTMVFASPIRLCLQIELHFFLITDYTEKYRSARCHGPALAVRTFHNGYRAIKF